MDVYGRQPSAPAGAYFQANVWAWHPIHALIIELCSDLLSKKVLRKLGHNEGAGPKDQETCTKMANRFEAWMERHTEGHGLESELRVTKEGRLVMAGDTEQETFSPFHVSDETLKEWIDFLRHCGGFEVW
jgi:hypothetical protein